MKLLPFIMGCALGCAVSASAQNKVLQLDGSESYVELPSKIFTDLDEATVEGWVKWDQLGSFSRFFDFGEEWRSMNLSHDGNSPNLQFAIIRNPGARELVTVPGILQLNQWCHIAAVSGKGGMRLYLNGMLVGTNAYTGSLAELKSGKNNYFGKSNWSPQFGNAYFQGQMDEIRVWKVARTGAQIRENLFKQLNGKEADLVGLWNFDDGTAKDSSASGHHGKFLGQAVSVVARLPEPAQLARPTVVYGRITNPEGRPAAKVGVTLNLGDAPVASAGTGPDGSYRLAVYATNDVYQLSVAQPGLSGKQSGIRLLPGEEIKIDLTLKEAVSLAGAILTANDQAPLSSVVVQVVKAEPARKTAKGTKTDRDDEVVATTLSDAKGKFKFIEVKPGAYQVRCHTLGSIVYHSDGKIYEVEKDKPILDLDFHLAQFKAGTWKNFSQSDGLANDRVRDIQAGAGGVVWFATAGGVTRFDGQKFSTLTKADGLASDQVNALLLDADEVLWVGTPSGLARFDESTKSFSRFSTTDGLADNGINSLFQDKAGRLWVGTDFGASRLDGKEFKSFIGTNEPAAQFVTGIADSANGMIWLGTFGSGVVRYDGTNAVMLNRDSGLADNRVQALLCEADETVWVGTLGHGITRYKEQDFVTLSKKDGLIDNTVHAIHRDADGVLWFGTERGVSRYDGKTFVNFTSADGLAHDTVRAIQRDSSGALWFGTDGGVSRYEEKSASKARPAAALVRTKAKSSAASKPLPKAANSQSAAPIAFKLNWQVGNRYVHRIDVTQTMEHKPPQAPKGFKQDFAMAQVYALSVMKERDGGGREVELEFLSQELEVRSGENVFVDFDSKNDSGDDTQNPMAGAMRRMIGPHLKFLLSADNKVEKIENFEAWMDQVTGGGPPQGRGMFSQIYSEDYFKQLVEHHNGFLNKSLKLGESVPAQTEVSTWIVGKVTLDLNNTLRGWERRDEHNCAVLQFSGPITTKIGFMSMMGRTAIDSGKGAGKLWFDPELGAVVASEFNQMLFTKMEMGPQQEGSNDISQTVTVRLVELGKVAKP